MRRAMLSLAGRAAGRAAGNSLVNSRAVSVVPSLQLGAATRAWNGCGLLQAQLAAEGGVGARAMSGDAATPQPEFDMDLLRALQIDHVEPSKIAAVLKLENMTLDQLKMLVDDGYHLPPGAKIMHLNPAEQAIMSRNATEWSPDLVHQLNPKRRFFPGQTYLPEELSPNYEIDYAKLRNAQKALGCPLGGKKGPKIDFCNISLLSRYPLAAKLPGGYHNSNSRERDIENKRERTRERDQQSLQSRKLNCVFVCVCVVWLPDSSRRVGRLYRAGRRWCVPRSR